MSMSEKYKEIFRLKGMLEKAGVPFKWIVRDDAGGYQICYPVGGSACVCSVIEHCFSYGNKFDKLEIEGLMTEKEKALHKDTVLGNLTAEDVFSRINNHFVMG